MKVSPVQGTPTIPNPSATGLSPDKIAAIKAMAMGQPKPEEKETIQLGEMPTSATNRIKMNVNRSTTMPIEEPKDLQENAVPLTPEPVTEPTVGISDQSVQAKPTPEAIGSVSPELAQLAKDKRALQIEREQLAKEKLALNGQSAEALINKLKASPLSVLQEHGVTYEQLTNEILGQQSQPQIDLTKLQEDLLKKVEEKLAGKDSAQEEAVYSFMRKEIDKACFSSDKYRFIREQKAQDKVMELIKREWRENGEIIDESDAMDRIETTIREDAKRYAKLIGELEPTETPAEQPQVQVTGQKTKTLTNKDSARPVMSRRQRAIAAALGQK